MTNKTAPNEEATSNVDSATVLSRIPQLDGVRGVAILLVVAAHSLVGIHPHNTPLFPSVSGWPVGGGFTGVQLFFVLSGYLITRILRAQLLRSGDIDFRAFYIRRARRLLPALVAACIAYALYAATLSTADAHAAFGAIIRAITYTTNLPFIFRNIPNSGWLGHCWSLAVEEQFYLAWPPFLAVVWKISPKRVVPAAWLIIAATVALRAVPPLVNASYGVLRWDALMVGSVLALTGWVPPRWLGALGIVVLAAYTVRMPDPLRTWDYLLSSLAAGVALSFAMQSSFTRSRVLRHLGDISYGLYLWHSLLQRFDISAWIVGPMALVIAELSFRYIETPFLRSGTRHNHDESVRDSTLSLRASLSPSGDSVPLRNENSEQ